MLIFENDYYKLYHNKQESEFCVITFTSFDAQERNTNTYFLHSPSKKLNLNTFGIVAKTDCWYMRSEFLEILEILRKNIPSGQKKLLFGSSMGGFAAVKYSKILTADYVLALAPQFSLDRSELDCDSFYNQFYKEYMRGMKPTLDETSGKIYILYDPSKDHEDETNFLRIQNVIPTVIGIKIFYAGHLVMNSLKGTDNFRKILDALHDEQSLRRTFHSIRRHNKSNLERLVLSASERHPGMACSCLFSPNSISSGASYKLVSNRDFRKSLFNHLIDNGNLFKIFDFMSNFYIRSSNIYFDGNVKSGEFFVFSYFGDQLHFSPETGRFSVEDRNTRIYPVIFDKKYNALFYRDLSGKAKITGNIKLEMDNHFFAVNFNNHYLSALPNGHIADDRKEAWHWEKFLLVPA